MSHPTTLVKDTAYWTLFTVYDPDNPGELIAPDSLPTVVVYKNGTANGDSVTVSLISTGLYKLTYNPASESTGDVFSLVITAVIAATNYPEAINFTVIPSVTEIQAGLATSAALTTVAGYLDTEIAAILEDTGTTLPAQIAALNVGGGTGARSVTITITDGTDPLENVNVRVTQGIESYVQTTNASGVATFSLDDATWTVRAAKAGYTMSNQSLVVNGTETATYAMSAVALSQPANPALVSHNVLCTGIDGEPEPGAIVYYRATAGTGTAGYSRDSGEASATADANGLATLTFIIGVTYAIRRGTIGREVTYVASATTPPETLGAP